MSKQIGKIVSCGPRFYVIECKDHDNVVTRFFLHRRQIRVMAVDEPQLRCVCVFEVTDKPLVADRVKRDTDLPAAINASIYAPGTKLDADGYPADLALTALKGEVSK